mmetsp:Transcript_112844/g.364423  ORF Transcript_112844/g.364423 Transcript_112844/m.364423 type:complete len:237 (-) Transcript_112844:225-935(-)
MDVGGRRTLHCADSGRDGDEAYRRLVCGMWSLPHAEVRACRGACRCCGAAGRHRQRSRRCRQRWRVGCGHRACQRRRRRGRSSRISHLRLHARQQLPLPPERAQARQDRGRELDGFPGLSGAGLRRRRGRWLRAQLGALCHRRRLRLPDLWRGLRRQRPGCLLRRRPSRRLREARFVLEPALLIALVAVLASACTDLASFMAFNGAVFGLLITLGLPAMMVMGRPGLATRAMSTSR